MASVNETVEKAIFNYPSLFANRTQVLHHLFVAFGNGYAWVNGELVAYDEDRADYTDDEVLLVLPERLTTPNPDEPESMQDLARQTAAEQEADNAERLRRRRNAAVLAQTAGPLAGQVFPPSEHAYVHDFPADIASDWAAARTEILAVVEPLWEAGEHLRTPEAPTPVDLKPETVALLKKMWAESGTN